jgi:hypothetical protein
MHLILSETSFSFGSFLSKYIVITASVI